MNNSEKGILAFLAGLATGATLGILFAPRSGEETRKIITDKADEYSDQAKQQVDEMIKAGKKEILKAQKKAMEAVEEVTKNFKEAEEALSDEVKGKV
ncbi:MAG: YtxH domain-containing protein [Saprospirales bacterium]|nr:MAG: YtxH domain-containing protein [Saprospirales bacterium]